MLMDILIYLCLHFKNSPWCSVMYVYIVLFHLFYKETCLEKMYFQFMFTIEVMFFGVFVGIHNYSKLRNTSFNCYRGRA